MATATGRCLCGKAAYEFDEDAVIWRGHCHCDDCRRACAAPVVSWFAVAEAAWAWTGAAPARRRSSARAERWFCPSCGTQLGYRTDRLPGEFHGLAATLDAPASYRPDAHFFHAEALPWLHVEDDLPRYLDGGRTLDAPGGAEPIEARLARARAELAEAGRLIREEIGAYPTPVSGCDAQYNHLVGRRGQVSDALAALEAAPFVATPRSPEPGAGIESR